MWFFWLFCFFVCPWMIFAVLKGVQHGTALISVNFASAAVAVRLTDAFD